jgi:hypothetical protein
LGGDGDFIDACIWCIAQWLGLKPIDEADRIDDWLYLPEILLPSC